MVKSNNQIKYEKLYTELQLTCKDLKEQLETTDPLKIDFEAYCTKIDYLKFELNKIYLYLLGEI